MTGRETGPVTSGVLVIFFLNNTSIIKQRLILCILYPFFRQGSRRIQHDLGFKFLSNNRDLNDHDNPT